MKGHILNVLLCTIQAKRKGCSSLFFETVVWLLSSWYICQPMGIIQIVRTEYFPLQDLKARLKEEISRVQSTVTDQRSEDNKDRMPCELEVKALMLNA